MRIEHFPAAFGLAAAVLAASCGPPRLRPDAVPAVAFPLGESARLTVRGPLLPRIISGPGGLVLAASETGHLQALDPEAKAVLWTFFGGSTRTAPVVDGDRIFWAASDGRVFGIDAKGGLLWSRTLGAPVAGEMRIVAGRLVFKEGDAALSALNTADGAVLWRDAASGPEEWTSGEGRILSRTANGRLRVLQPDGRLVREFPIDENAAGGIGLAGKLVFLGFTDGKLGAYDYLTGKKRWMMRLGGIPVGSPVSDGQVVYVTLSNHVVAALRARRGDLLWWRPLAGRAAFPPVLYGNHIFVPSRSPVLQAFLRGDGTESTGYQAEAEISAEAAIIGLRIYLATNGEAEGRSQVRALDLVPPPPPEKTPTPETKIIKEPQHDPR